MKRPKFTVIVTLLALVLGGHLIVRQAAAQGGGGLLVAPTRVVFEGRTRSAGITLVNRGDEAATYRISLSHFRMNEFGRLEAAEKPRPGELFSADFIRFSPRQVTLAPGASQTIRLLVRKPRGLPVGEYRSRLVMRGVPPENLGEDIEDTGDDDGQIRVRLIAVFGVSIPVIVRHGDLSVEATISDLSFEPRKNESTPAEISFRINRNGTRSLYGDISVIYRSKDGKEVELRNLAGIAVYTPNPSRTMRLRLQLPEGVTLSAGKLYVTYRERPEQSDGVQAEAELALP